MLIEYTKRSETIINREDNKKRKKKPFCRHSLDYVNSKMLYWMGSNSSGYYKLYSATDVSQIHSILLRVLCCLSASATDHTDSQHNHNLDNSKKKIFIIKHNVIQQMET